MFRKTIVLVALVASFGANAQSVSYSTTFLNPFGGNHSAAYAINDAGVVVGRANLSNNINDRGFVWANGVAENVGTLGGPHSRANGLNNDNLVVGNSFTQGAFRWQDGLILDLDPAPTTWHFFEANDVNEAGFIVGDAHNQLQFPFNRQQAILQRSSGITLLAPSANNNSYAKAINDNNDVVGYSEGGVATVWRGESPNPWEPKSLMSLGYGSTIAHDINNAGLIVGESLAASGHSAAVVWQDEQIMRLQGLTGGNARAYAVNESGQVVGYSDGPTSGTAVIWENGRVIDLNLSLSDSDRESGWSLTVARDINESGWIVGEAFNSKLGLTSAFVMSPTPAIPEPSVAAMLLAGLGLLRFAALRRNSN